MTTKEHHELQDHGDYRGFLLMVTGRPGHCGGTATRLKAGDTRSISFQADGETPEEVLASLHAMVDAHREKWGAVWPPRGASPVVPTTYVCEAGHETLTEALERFYVGDDLWVRCPVCDAEEHEAEQAYHQRTLA